MSNITPNLPPQFRIRPTTPFSFFDYETNVIKYLNDNINGCFYEFITHRKSYMIICRGNSEEFKIVKGFISEQDLIDGIVKGKLEIVNYQNYV